MHGEPTDEDRAYEERLQAGIDEALAALSEQQARVLTLYFGLADTEPMSLSELAAELGMTRDEAQHLKDSSLARLRRGPGGHAGSAALLPPNPVVPLDGVAEAPQHETLTGGPIPSAGDPGTFRALPFEHGDPDVT